jgi:hypothetical protein
MKGLLLRISKNTEISNIQKKEEIYEHQVHLENCRTYLIHYRSHIMRKYVEGIADRNVLKNLKEDKLQAICDYKMKILAGFYKEPMYNFFAKRGTSCLGFMLAWLSG